MLTLRTASAMLASCADGSALRALLRHLGFMGAPLPVNDMLRASLGVDARVKCVELVMGRGALRVCAVEVTDDAPSVSIAAELARELARRAPHGLWMVAAVQRRPAVVVLAVPTESGVVSVLSVDRSHVVDSDAEAFCLLASIPFATTADLATHARWGALLGRDALNRRFYRVLERQVRGLAEDARGGRPAERDELALVYSSRLLFLAFLQSKGWLDGDHGFLQRVYDDCVAGRGDVHRRVFRPLFFGTLNTPLRARAPVARGFGRVPFLNGGLFAPVGVERGARAPELSDASLGAFLRDVLGRYRFTASEERTTATGAAVDPEMLGRAFESLMASRERRASGAFYTPSAFVGRVADGGLLRALRSLLPPHASCVIDSLQRNEPPPPSLREATRTALGRLTVLDPACGSGAFLVHALERVAGWRVLAGDDRPPDHIRRDLLANTIFGIDRDPTAVWLCELRLWLAVAVECEEPDPLRVLPLPNLDRNIRVGDALGPLAPGAVPSIPTRRGDGGRFAGLRARYASASGVRKERAGAALDAAERAMSIASLHREGDHLRAVRRDVLAARRSRDLFGGRTANAALDREAATLRTRATALRRERRRLLAGGALPFRYDAHFADVLAAGGFSAVIGNPPWVRLHRIPAAERTVLRERFASLRDAAWSQGALAGGAGSGFAGQADLSALFIERSHELLCPGGVLALLVPAKLWCALAGGGIRVLLAGSTKVHVLEDCTDAPDLFEAVTYPSIVVAERTPDRQRARSASTGVSVHRGTRVVEWEQPLSRLAFDESPGSPWLMLPPPVRAAFDRLLAVGSPMHTAGFGRPIMGVKSGLNDAFIVTPDTDSDPAGANALAAISGSEGRRGTIESALLRPVIRGEHIRPWCIGGSGEHIIWTHDCTGPLSSLPAHAARWLGPHRARLAGRTDARGRAPWWSLHRTEGADGRRARVIWSDMSRSPRAAWLAPGDTAVPLNTCYVLHCPAIADAQAFVALFNSPIAAAWLRCLAEPARGGYRRMFAWTAALFPLPADWPRARDILAPFAVRAQRASGQPVPAAADLLDAALDAYGISHRSIAPLLQWNPDSTS